MRVILAFDNIACSEAPDLGDAFWLVDSASNRRLAEAAWKSNRYAANSAVFAPPLGAVRPADVLQRLDDVDLHHPDWREIRLSGVTWTTELQTAFEGQNLAVKHSVSVLIIER